MSLAARAMTADEFFAATVELPRAQLIDGELVVPVASPLHRHQKIVKRLLQSHWTFAADHPDAGDLGLPQDVVIDVHNVFQPDLYWVPEGEGLADDARHFDANLPPLVIEVLSPSTRHHDVGRKRRGYLEAGVQEVWIADGEADRLTVHRADGSTGRRRSAPRRSRRR